MKQAETVLAAILPGGITPGFHQYVRNLRAILEWMERSANLAVPEADAENVVRRLAPLRNRIIVHPMPTAAARDFTRRVLELAQLPNTSTLLAPFVGDIAVSLEGKSTLRGLLEESPVPVLLIPVTAALPFPPFESIVVPVSGEAGESHALELGLDLGNSRGLPVEIVHVTPGGGRAPMFESLGDAFHHEYPKRIEQFIAQAAPHHSLAERGCIRNFVHCSGNVGQQVMRESRKSVSPLIVVDWKGKLSAGRARVLKEILSRAKVPVLVAREIPPRSFKLKIGSRLVAGLAGRQ